MRPIGVWMTIPELSGIEWVMRNMSTVKCEPILIRSSVVTSWRSTSLSLSLNSSNLPRSSPSVSFAPYIGIFFGSCLSM